jgi:hypothetical protein
MKTYLDVPLVDAELLAEVQLTIDLMIAASNSPDHLTDVEIDQIFDRYGEDQPT